MTVIEKKTGERINVMPFYLHGRVVAYTGDLVVTCEDGSDINLGRRAWLPTEIEIFHN